MKPILKIFVKVLIALLALKLIFDMLLYFSFNFSGGPRDTSGNLFVIVSDIAENIFNIGDTIVDYRIKRELTDNLHMTCVTEAESHPPLDPQADQWFKKARCIQKGEEPGTIQEVIALYERAIDRKHWKAYPNLASIYLNGEGVKEDTSKGIDILEAGMKLDIARCYAMMADCLSIGLGVNEDRVDSWVYTRRAAELGDSDAQYSVGNKLYMMGYDEGISIMECAAKQDNAGAANELGMFYGIGATVNSPEQQKSLRYYQQATRLGNYDAALQIWGAFDEGDMKVAKDPERAKRYYKIIEFIQAKNYDGIDDFHITNLDAIVPLPPAPLPKWNGKIEIAK